MTAILDVFLGVCFTLSFQAIRGVLKAEAEERLEARRRHATWIVDNAEIEAKERLGWR